MAGDDGHEVRWNVLFNPEAAWLHYSKDALLIGIAGLVRDLGRARASAYLHTLANTVRRVKPNVLLIPLLPAHPRPRRGQPKKRDIQQHAKLFLEEQKRLGPDLTYREFGRRVLKEAEQRGHPLPFKSLEGYATELGKAVRSLQAKRGEATSL